MSAPTDLRERDRATWRLRRAWHLAGWPLLGLTLAAVVTGLVEALVQQRLYWRLEAHSILIDPQPVLTGPGLTQTLLTAAVAGAAGVIIGELAGRSSWRPRAIAIAVAGMYTGALAVLAAPATPSVLIAHILAAALSIPASYVTARTQEPRF
ncbi:hypothetical protein ER308_08945 [Egibacter rhizosphaerae]|uniref:Uncharacterized protein n=1 Tax=Egibacter rhizosphaerae TaxID=1670831 RepID=A0A411YEI3_9ACTN|nr:hypothetical protein [Egibacter rhizosphaerae]QBI19663.1 hypothetical protein ER308_08945 [Egibacter rhizosphaerae]